MALSIEDALSIAYEDGFDSACCSPGLDWEGYDMFDYNTPRVSEPLQQENGVTVLYTDADVKSGVMVEPVQLQWTTLPTDIPCDAVEPTDELTTTLHSCQFCKGLFTDEEYKLHKCPNEPEPTVLNVTGSQTNTKTATATNGYRELRKSKIKTPIKKQKAKDELSVRTRNDRGPHVCHVCNKSLSRQSSLMIHMRRHTGEMPFECDFCKKKFVVLYDLDRHLLTHVKAKKFSCYCDVCRKPFFSKSGLIQHKRKHHISTLHSCDVCGLTFTRKSKMVVHKVGHQPENAEPDTPDIAPQNLQVLVLFDNNLT